MGLLPGGNRTGRKENMNEEQAKALATEGKKKETAFWAAFKEKVVTLWKSGRKGKAICIGGAVVVLLLLTRCGGSNNGESGSAGSIDTGRGGEYTGQNFSDVFMGAKADEGVIYKFSSNISIKVLQATKEGNLVGYIQGANPFADGLESLFGSFGGSFDRIVWVVTPGKLYEDNQTLGSGFYIRRGSYEYEGTDGGTHTVARYVEVTDEATLTKIQKHIEDEKAAEAQAKLEAEGQPFEVNAPVKSLCGFSIGATPNSVKSLFTDLSEGEDTMSGILATPFRHFDFAQLKFSPAPVLGGKHLSVVTLTVKGRSPLTSAKEAFEEVETIVAMLEKKFGITFRNTLKTSVDCNYDWRSERSNDSVSQTITVWCSGSSSFGLTFRSDFFSPKEEAAMKEKQNPAKLSADAGVDQL